MDPGAGGQFDDIAVRIAEIDRADKAVVDRPADLATLALPLLQHAVECIGLDPEGDVQIERVLLFEIEGLTGHLEKREAGAVVHLEEGVQPATLIDLERADQAQTEEILIKDPRLLRVPAAIRVMMQTFDHVSLRSPFAGSQDSADRRSTPPDVLSGIPLPAGENRLSAAAKRPPNTENPLYISGLSTIWPSPPAA